MYLPISVSTYEEAKQLKIASESAGDISISLFNYFNVLFLDKDYKVIGQLLEKKASISEIFINGYQNNHENKDIDRSVKNILYKIGFDDSNKDSKLNSLDDHDLYISDLEGKNLTQVTSKKQIIDFKFINSNTQIFIQYKDRNGMRDEYNHVKFSLYNISTRQFSELKDIEDKLIDIESKLIR